MTMAKRIVKWFHPKRETGFSKDNSVESNLRIMYKHCPKNYTKHSCWLLVGRQAQSLSNVSQDVATKIKARQVAKAAFAKLK